MVAAVLSIAFGVLGILTLGIVFTPLAALCALVGLISGARHMSFMTLFVSAIGAVLTIAGIATSPALIAAALGLIGIAHGAL